MDDYVGHKYVLNFSKYDNLLLGAEETYEESMLE